MAYPSASSQLVASRLEQGLSAHGAGDIERALKAYREVLAVAPAHAPALNLLGTGLLQLGRTREALPFLERAALQQRNDANLMANVAQAYLALERYDEARESFRKASRIAPQEARFHVGVAAALALQGKRSEAKSLLQKLATRFPAAPLVWLNLGNVLRDERQYDPAMNAYRKALELEPRMIEARNSIGSVLHTMMRFDEAEQEYRACIDAAPDDLVPRYNLASVTIDAGKFSEAERVSREIVARAPQSADAHRLLGVALGLQSRLLEALSCYARAADIAPDDRQTAQTYGTALMEVGRAAEGLRWLRHVASLGSQSAGLEQVTSGALLAHGSLQDGWIGYTQRPAALELREIYKALNCARSLPQTLTGKHVCVIAEQGLGDQLFFLRYAAELKARGARVSHRASEKLFSLLQRANALDMVLPEDRELPAADFYVLLGDLPRALHELPSSATPDTGAGNPEARRPPDFARRIAVFWPGPPHAVRIAPLALRLAEMGERLSTFGPPPYVGVTWRGGIAPDQQQDATWRLYKSIDPGVLAGALEGVAGTVVALQRNPAPGELDAVSAALRRPVHDLTQLNDDLEGMLALLSLLDEYVGVSNTNMHLRAAAGKTARVLVPVPAEWRWMRCGRSSPWFPGFCVYRQSLSGGWVDAYTDLNHDLHVNQASSTCPDTG